MMRKKPIAVSMSLTTKCPLLTSINVNKQVAIIRINHITRIKIFKRDILKSSIWLPSNFHCLLNTSPIAIP